MPAQIQREYMPFFESRENGKEVAPAAANTVQENYRWALRRHFCVVDDNVTGVEG
jgi:hypothetical protein